MRAVIQRVQEAQVIIEGRVYSQIGPGILTLLGIAKGDGENQVRKLLQKIRDLRIFSDDQGKMNRSLVDIQGSHMIVSQFTLLGDCNSGRRPSFTGAEKPELAKPLFEKALEISSELGMKTVGGVFQADMKISLINDGPVTFVLEDL